VQWSPDTALLRESPNVSSSKALCLLLTLCSSCLIPAGIGVSLGALGHGSPELLAGFEHLQGDAAEAAVAEHEGAVMTLL
jgi:hypothetical protein